jgi:hypothetical protein
MRRLIANGHTTATEMQNPKLKPLQLYITRKDAKNLDEIIYTPRSLAQARERS